MDDPLAAPHRCETLRPGDRVLVVIGHSLTQQSAQQAAEKLGAQFPDVQFTVLDAHQVFVQHAEEDR